MTYLESHGASSSRNYNIQKSENFIKLLKNYKNFTVYRFYVVSLTCRRPFKFLDRPIRITRSAKDDLQWWIHLLEGW